METQQFFNVLSSITTKRQRRSHLHQLDNIKMVQFLKDGDLLVDPLQGPKDFGLLSEGCLWSSRGRATCSTYNVSLENESDIQILILDKKIITMKTQRNLETSDKRMKINGQSTSCFIL